METIKLEYSEAFIKRAVKSYWLKQVGLLFPCATVMMFLLLVYLLFNGGRPWFVGLLASAVFFAIAVITASYFVHLTRALARLRRMKSPEANLELTDRRFSVVSDVGATEFEWSIIIKVWKFEEVWLLFFSAGEFMTLPINCIPEKSKEFMLKKLKENGVKVL